MNKTLMCAACAATLLLASTATAQVMTYSEGDGGSGTGVATMNVTSYVGDGPDAGTANWSEGSPVQIQIQGDGSMPPAGVTHPLPPIKRETNRQLIERMRREKNNMQNGIAPQTGGNVTFEQHVETVGGTTSGQVRIYRKENGQVVEDRTIQLPAGKPGMPVFFRASTTHGTDTPPGAMIRTIAASGSRAIFLRGSASSTGIPWLDNEHGFTTASGRVTSSTTADGNVVFSFEQKRPPIQDFMNKIFTLFKRAAGDNQ